MGVIEKVCYSEWAAPIVPVVKPDNSIRVCGDYKVTVNSVLEVDQHPLPNPEELFVTLSGGGGGGGGSVNWICQELINRLF